MYTFLSCHIHVKIHKNRLFYINHATNACKRWFCRLWHVWNWNGIQKEAKKKKRRLEFTWMDNLCLSYKNCGHNSHKRRLRICPYPERAQEVLQVGLWVHLPMQKWYLWPVPLIHSSFTAKFYICLCLGSVTRRLEEFFD